MSQVAIRGWIVLAVLTVLAAGCTPGVAPAPSPTTPSPTGTPIRTPTGTPPTVEEPTRAASPAPNTLLIVNDTGIEICYIHIAPTGADAWGPNQLAESERVPSGGRREFTHVPPNSYDILLGDCEENLVAQANGVPLGQERFTWALGPLIEPTFANRGDQALCALYISPSFAMSWGPEQLEGERIEPGATIRLEPLPEGTYDVRTETCDGAQSEVYQVAVAADSTYTFGE